MARMPMDKIDMLALSRSIDDICIDNDIEARTVINWMLEERMINLEDYYPEEDEDE
jgi:hypothetical protein